MGHRMLEAGEQLPCFRRDVCQSGFISSKGPNGLQRLKQGDGHHFDLFPRIFAQDVGTDEAVDALQPGEDRRAKEFLISLGMLGRCPASPEASNQGHHLCSTPCASTARAVEAWKRMVRTSAYSGESYQALKCSVSANSITTSRCGCQSPSIVEVVPPRTRNLPP